MKSRGFVWARNNNYKVKLSSRRRKKKGRMQVVSWSFPKQAKYCHVERGKTEETEGTGNTDSPGLLNLSLESNKQVLKIKDLNLYLAEGQSCDCVVTGTRTLHQMELMARASALGADSSGIPGAVESMSHFLWAASSDVRGGASWNGSSCSQPAAVSLLPPSTPWLWVVHAHDLTAQLALHIKYSTAHAAVCRNKMGRSSEGRGDVQEAPGARRLGCKIGTELLRRKSQTEKRCQWPRLK